MSRTLAPRGPLKRGKVLRGFLLAGVISWAMLPASARAAADNRATLAQTVDMMADSLIGRPLGLAASLFGSGVFVLTLPFVALGAEEGETQVAAEKMVYEPAAFTFTRSLGEGN